MCYFLFRVKFMVLKDFLKTVIHVNNHLLPGERKHRQEICMPKNSKQCSQWFQKVKACQPVLGQRRVLIDKPRAF